MEALAGIPLYSYLTFITGAMSLSQGILVLVKNRASLTNRLFFYFCLGIAVWLLSMTLVSSRKLSYAHAVFMGKILYTGVVFLPTLALHYSVAFLGKYAPKRVGLDLKIAYALTFLFLILLWTTDRFITGIYHYSWGDFPKAGIIHVFHTVFLTTTALYAIYLLWRGLNAIKADSGKNNKYYETKYLLIALTFVTLCCSDFLHNWGIDFFPLGCIFITIFVFATTYAIFKHELMGVTLAVKKSLVYSVVLSVITVLYFAIVYVIGTAVGRLETVHSFPVILGILAVITLLFRPIELKVQKAVDSLFSMRPRELIEKENLLLLEEVQQKYQMKAVATLAAGMAHEIKNPLTAIKTFTEHLTQKSEEPGFLDRFEKIVSAEVDKIDSIVRQVLEFSKPSPLQLERLNLSNVLNETLDLLNGHCVKQHIKIDRLLQDIFIQGDKKQLKQAFLNIILNSIEAMPEGGRLSVAINEQTDE